MGEQEHWEGQDEVVGVEDAAGGDREPGQKIPPPHEQIHPKEKGGDPERGGLELQGIEGAVRNADGPGGEDRQKNQDEREEDGHEVGG